MRYLRHRDRLREGNGALGSWLFRVATNLAFDDRRKRRPDLVDVEPIARHGDALILRESVWPLITLEAFLGVVIGLGIAGRAAAFVLLFPVGLSIAFGEFNPNRALALGGALTMLILGTGKFSLWQPEESLFSRRAGERRA